MADSTDAPGGKSYALLNVNSQVKVDATEAVNTLAEKSADVVDDVRGGMKRGILAEVRELAKDVVGEWRYRWLEMMKHRTDKKLSDRGVRSPRVLPPAAIPHLKEASWGEDERLRELWAGLIADARDPEQPRYTPSFGRALLEFGPAETMVFLAVGRISKRQRTAPDTGDFLERLKKAADSNKELSDASRLQLWTNAILRLAGMTRRDLIDEAGIDDDEAIDAIGVLLRLNVLEGGRREVPMAVGGAAIPPTSALDSVILTDFGRALYRRTTGDATPLLPTRPW